MRLGPHGLIEEPRPGSSIVMGTKKPRKVPAKSRVRITPSEPGHQITHDLSPVATRQKRRVDQHRSGDVVWIGAGEIERDQPTKAVADHHRALDAQLRARRRKVFGEQSHRVPLRRGIALAMAAQVHGDDPMSSAEARDLPTPKTPITRRAMHEHKGRVTASRAVIRQHNTITNQIHRPQCCHAAPRRERLPQTRSRIDLPAMRGNHGADAEVARRWLGRRQGSRVGAGSSQQSRSDLGPRSCLPSSAAPVSSATASPRRSSRRVLLGAKQRSREPAGLPARYVR